MNEQLFYDLRRHSGIAPSMATHMQFTVADAHFHRAVL